LPKRLWLVKTSLAFWTTGGIEETVLHGFIFDLDGTLVDSLPGITTSLNHVLADYGLGAVSESKVKTLIGDGLLVLVKRVLKLSKESLLPTEQEFAMAFQRHYAKDWQGGTKVFPRMIPLLEKLYRDGKRLAVLSNKPHPFTVEIVEGLFPPHLFDVVIGHQDAFPKKPDPTSTLQIIERWGLSTKEVAYVGDSTVDLETAEAAGAHPLIFSWGYGTPEGVHLLHSVNDFEDAVRELT
jgi:phosphoglycolate phosphatase